MHKLKRPLILCFSTLSLITFASTPAHSAGSASDLRMITANGLILQHRWQDACNALTVEITKDPANADAYFQRALCYYRLTQYDRALSDMQRCLQIEPNTQNIFTYSRLGDCNYVKGNYQEAIACYSRSIAMDPSFPNNYRERASCYTKLGQMGAAQADLVTLTQLGGPVSADTSADFATKMLSLKAMSTKTNKGYVLRVPVSDNKPAIDLAAKYIRAIKEQTARIEANPADGEAYIERAEAFEMTDNHAKALADYNHIIDSEKSTKLAAGCIESAFYGKASILLKIGQYQESLACYKTILERDQSSEEGMYGQGYCLIKLGQYKEAVMALNAAEKLSNGKIAKVFEARAQAYTAMGDRDAAQRDLQTAQSLKAKSK